MGVVYQFTQTGGVAASVNVTRAVTGPNEGNFTGAATLRAFWNSGLLGPVAPALPPPLPSYVLVELAGGPTTYEKTGELTAGTLAAGGSV